MRCRGDGLLFIVSSKEPTLPLDFDILLINYKFGRIEYCCWFSNEDLPSSNLVRLQIVLRHCGLSAFHIPYHVDNLPFEERKLSDYQYELFYSTSNIFLSYFL